MVNGQWRVEEGQIVGFDVDRLRAQHTAAAQRFS